MVKRVFQAGFLVLGSCGFSMNVAEILGWSTQGRKIIIRRGGLFFHRFLRIFHLSSFLSFSMMNVHFVENTDRD